MAKAKTVDEFKEKRLEEAQASGREKAAQDRWVEDASKRVTDELDLFLKKAKPEIKEAVLKNVQNWIIRERRAAAKN